ncbi:MAG: glycosyltransferase [Thermoanaerobaculia bacterium]|nr:glycosyltransferase [Thermoanaerobaculia bacterium]
MPEAVDRPRSCFFELSFRDRPSIRIGPSPILRNPFVARDQAFASLPSDDWRDIRLLSGVLHSAISRLSERCRAFEIASDQVEFGARGFGIDTSLVIPLGNNFHIVEAQLASFAEDSSLRSTEIVYLLDGPQHRAAVEHLIFHCSILYDLPPIRLVALDWGCVGSAAAINFAVARAVGRDIVIMHSDVIAEQAGWLVRMLAVHRDPKVGAVAPLLVSRDGSVQHAGVTFSCETTSDRLWSALDRWKGLPLDCPGVKQSGRVVALRDPVLLTSRSLFERLGGYRDCYVAGDLEGVDYCLRVAETGLERHYVSERPLCHLEFQTKQWGAGWRRSGWSQLYNRWLMTRNWGDFLALLDTSSQDGIEVAKERTPFL